MIKRNIPFALAYSIYEIPAAFYKSLGIRYLLVDLDNTLDPYFVDEPREDAIAWKKAMDEAGLTIVILSNNTGKRVGHYAQLLGVRHECWMRKPFSGPLKKFLKRENIDPNEAILIGDQIQTDVKAGNGAGVRTILTEPIDPDEPPWTKFNRLFDMPKRKKIYGQKLAKEWREITL